MGRIAVVTGATLALGAMGHRKTQAEHDGFQRRKKFGGKGMVDIFAKLKLEYVTIEECDGQFVLGGLDASAQQILRNFLARPSTLTLEPKDAQEQSSCLIIQ